MQLAGSTDDPQDTAVVIVLDWSRPANMVSLRHSAWTWVIAHCPQTKELVAWLRWIQQWAESAAEQGQVEEMRERRQSCRAASARSLSSLCYRSDRPQCSLSFSITTSRLQPQLQQLDLQAPVPPHRRQRRSRRIARLGLSFPSGRAHSLSTRMS